MMKDHERDHEQADMRAGGPNGVRDGAVDARATDAGEAPRRPRSRRHHLTRHGLRLLIVLCLPVVALALVFAFMAVTHRPLSLPEIVVSRVETRLNAALGGRLRVDLGRIELLVDEGVRPRLQLRTVRVLADTGRPVAVFPQLRATFWAAPLLQGNVELRSVRVGGAAVSLHRLEDGSLDLDLGGEGLPHIDLDNLSDMLEGLEAAFDVPALRRLETIRAATIGIRLDDARLGRVWRVSDGTLNFVQDAEALRLDMSMDVGEAQGDPATVRLDFSTSKTGRAARFGAAVIGVPARDLAVQSPALAGLSVIDATISGALTSGLDDQGRLAGLDARLDISEGALNPVDGAKPLPFQGGNMHLAFDPGSQRVELKALSLRSDALRLLARGHALLRDFSGGLPRVLLTQITIDDLKLDPEGVFEAPAQFSEGALDLRITLDPFRVDLGQAQLIAEDTRISTRGTLSADAQGWHASFDTVINQISSAELLRLWPRALVEKTRNWVVDNIPAGSLHDVRAAVRLVPGQEPRFSLGYEFRDTVARVVRTLPVIQEGRGFAVLSGRSYVMRAEEGHVKAPGGGQIEVADTVLDVPDIRVKPAPANVHLVTSSTIPAMLSLLDEPPFNFLSKAGMGTDIASGWAEAETDLQLILKKGLKPDEIGFNVRARLSGVESDRLVPGHVLTSEDLRLSADREGLTIGGRGEFSGLPFDAHWHQGFGPEHRGRSQVNGFAQVTPEALDQLGVSLPEGMLSGKGWASLDLELTKGAPATFRAVTDLVGLGLQVPQIGWSLGQAAKGRLEVVGALSSPPVVDTIDLDTAGLKARGSLTLKAGGGGFDRARFPDLRIGDWFAGAAELRGRGAGASPAVSITSGALDLRKMGALGGGSGGSGGGGSGGGGASTPIDVSLDRITVADGFALTSARGAFNTRGGINGTFNGRLNGGALIEGAVGPAANGRSAVNITSDDAGGVLASAGLFDGARGGAFGLNLVPVSEQSYDGSAAIRGLKVTQAPTLADMLSAASIVGLVEQLQGDGIVFQEINAGFRLTPQGISIAHAEATGASMGVTMSGNYLPSSGVIDLEGVISPLYIVNGIGQFLSRRGEGLFGFTYDITGTRAAPKVSINPLSILTPGVFREIFRRDPGVLRPE